MAKEKKELTHKEAVKDDIGKYSALEAVKNSEGGQLLIESLRKDIVSCMDSLASKYKDGSHTELIALCAKMSERMTLSRTLMRSSKNKRMAKEELKTVLEE